MINSMCTFMRKELKIKGRTEHNGRGVYDMGSDKDYKEVKMLIEMKLDKWKEQGLVEKYEVETRQDDRGTGERLILIFNKDKVKNSFYRTFCTGHHSFYGQFMNVSFSC